MESRSHVEVCAQLLCMRFRKCVLFLENINSLQGSQKSFLERVQQGLVIVMTPEMDLFDSRSNSQVKACLDMAQESYYK